MPRAVKVAVSLPAGLFESVEQERERRQEGRSEFFQQALQAFLASLEERKAVERYVRGYQEMPEEPGEVRAMEAVSVRAIASEPWD